ncbi:MAG: glycoside hydrolase N-terminal domain-containing protein [Clostridia bacterium]|nr:glycoside hydrolase N-terminal domain-containing protein [Clostridia bacterium]
MKKYELWYKQETPFGRENASSFEENVADDGWEKWSLPIGNGYMGVKLFGRTNIDRYQITMNTLFNPYFFHNNKRVGGLNNFAEIYTEFNHKEVEEYKRGLVLNTGICYTQYKHKGITYTREHFTSYPDKVFVTKISSDKEKSVSFSIHADIPFVKPYLAEEGDGCGKEGEVTYFNNLITLHGRMEYYNILFEGQIIIRTKGGKVTTCNNNISVIDADSAELIVAADTNYKFDSKVFLEENPQKKLDGFEHPHKSVSEIIAEALKYTYEDLKKRHIDDFNGLFSRANVELCDEISTKPTDEMLDDYKKGIGNLYLEELYFQYGRYLLISSSRPGTYPANLQGIWNQYENSPWSSGYWHNINVQMNYWPAFNTNLIEMFEPYVDYFKAYLPLAQNHATKYITSYYNDKHEEGQGNDGWIIGTGGWLYNISGLAEPSRAHSGPGTGGFTSKLFSDYYYFTMDDDILKNLTYPAVYSMSKFLSKVVEESDGKYLVKYSASPEQAQHGKYYNTEGCAFDQQIIYETYSDTLKFAQLLGDDNGFIQTIKKQINDLDPVLVGKSGQIKEYREEIYYGDIGEYHHRHISMLVGLYPGTVINSSTPEWMEAASVSLNMRGDESTGWSTAHKLNAWARIKNGKRAYDLFNMILRKCTLPNLWDTHPPFQIDGNFGATAGVAEMLLQSHEGFIHVLPALPDQWKNGCFDGLTARGAFEVGVTWQDKLPKEIRIKSKAGKTCKIYVGEKLDGINYIVNNGYIEFDTEKNKEYIIRLR